MSKSTGGPPARIQIYNDAYAAVARDRHPALLGQPAADGWPETYAAVIAPLLAETDAGRAVRITDFPVALRGPPGVALRSSILQIFALALHELATNALKYGAQAQRRLEIRWHVRPGSLEPGALEPGSLKPASPGGEPWLQVDWRERGVRMAAGEGAPASGAGRELIEQALPYQLGAGTTYAIHADGVHCSIALPVSGRMMTGTIAEGADDA